MSESAPVPDAVTTPGAPAVTDARARVGAVVEILLCSSVPTQFAVIAVLQAAGWTAIDGAGHPVMGFVVTQLVADTALVIALMVVFIRAHGDSPAALWIGNRPVTREVLLGIATVPIMFFLVGITLNALRLFAPGLHNVPTNPLEQLATPRQAPLFAFLAIVSGGVKEELQRAFMLQRFER